MKKRFTQIWEDLKIARVGTYALVQLSLILLTLFVFLTMDVKRFPGETISLTLVSICLLSGVFFLMLLIFLAIVFAIDIAGDAVNVWKHIFREFLIRRRSIKSLNAERVKIPRLAKPPGHIWLQVAKFLPEKYYRIFEQEVSDMRLEYYEALSEKATFRAKCLIATYHLSMTFALIVWIVRGLKEIVKIS